MKKNFFFLVLICLLILNYSQNTFSENVINSEINIDFNKIKQIKSNNQDVKFISANSIGIVLSPFGYPFIFNEHKNKSLEHSGIELFKKEKIKLIRVGFFERYDYRGQKASDSMIAKLKTSQFKWFPLEKLLDFAGETNADLMIALNTVYIYDEISNETYFVMDNPDLYLPILLNYTENMIKKIKASPNGNKVKYWEIGNESYSMLSPVDYATIAMKMIDVIRKADPGSKISINIHGRYKDGGWWNKRKKFNVRDLYKILIENGYKNKFDAITLHIYGDAIKDKHLNNTEILQELNLADKKFWISEYNFLNASNELRELKQRTFKFGMEYLINTLQLAHYKQIEILTFFSVPFTGFSEFSNGRFWSARLIKSIPKDKQKKARWRELPAGVFYSYMINILEQTPYLTKLSNEKIPCWLFFNPQTGKYNLLLFNNLAKSQQLTLNTENINKNMTVKIIELNKSANLIDNEGETVNNSQLPDLVLKAKSKRTILIKPDSLLTLTFRK